MSRFRNDLFKREVINQRNKRRTKRRKNIKKLRDIRRGRRWTIETTYIKLTFIKGNRDGKEFNRSGNV